MINLNPVIKYFTIGNAPKREKVLMAILLMGIPLMIIGLPIYLLNQKPKPQEPIMGGLAKIPREYRIPEQRFFDTPYSGDTACFEMINDTTMLLVVLERVIYL